jgi:hypothetical protein
MALLLVLGLLSLPQSAGANTLPPHAFWNRRRFQEQMGLRAATITPGCQQPFLKAPNGSIPRRPLAIGDRYQWSSN